MRRQPGLSAAGHRSDPPRAAAQRGIDHGGDLCVFVLSCFRTAEMEPIFAENTPGEPDMNDKPTRLGRGLAALIGDMATVEGARVTESGGVKKLPVEFIIANRANPRRTFNSEQLEELTNSIREKGVMQPLLVRPSDDPNIFEIIAGERRW